MSWSTRNTEVAYLLSYVLHTAENREIQIINVPPCIKKTKSSEINGVTSELEVEIKEAISIGQVIATVP